MTTTQPTSRAALLTPKQASEYLSIPVGTLANWRYQGDGPRYVKAGRLVRYRAVDLDSWLTGTYPSAA
ncbi:helix-turn-helix domain-containing protein [Streptomyces sp. NBC_01261]|uniref:helix-turn-helix domain-containing protein n=1 Tax=Streptomyces sp. NBC_01261 TaxID=2903802 RepID=UPI002E300863|nr:helix-turn-helix domain-containing protein [Streptomyces sp. NBC_01261]